MEPTSFDTKLCQLTEGVLISTVIAHLGLFREQSNILITVICKYDTRLFSK